MTDLNSTLAEMRARVDHGVYAGPWAIDHLPTVFGLYDAGMAYRGEGTVLLGSAFQPNVANRIVTDHNDLPKLLAAVEAVVALHRPLRYHEDADRCGHDDDEHTIIHSADGDPLCGETFTLADPPQCEECGDVYGEDNDWPCPTIRALNTAMGVTND